jgi:hypothetical protein
MNTIATTYPHTTLTSDSGTGSGLWGSMRAALRRVAARSEAPLPVRDAVREAGAVRTMADSIRISDPHFAADLYAAADRHEVLYAGGGSR